MGIEIEHKYLVINNSFKELAVTKHHITQGYLSKVPERTVRIRIINDKGFITVKGKNEGDRRIEFEYEIPVDDARSLMTLCMPGIIEKYRYIVPFGGYIWEIDEFLGERYGLTIAEIEIPSSDSEYLIPNFIGENVTGNPIYYNSNL